MRRSWLRAWLACSLVLLGGVSGAEEVAADAEKLAGDPALEGFWSGNIEVPNRPIEVHVLLEQASAAWTATIDVPLQAIRRAEMIGVAVAGKDATFQIPGVPGDPTFEGKLSADGKTLAGSFTQGGQPLPFRLERAEKPADYDVDLYADYRKAGRQGEGAVGEWLGLLEAGPHRYRMKLNVTSAEGAFRATLVSVDQRGTSFDADTVTVDGSKVTFGVDRIGATFEGTLAADGSEISGSWIQGGQGLPLSFRRAG